MNKISIKITDKIKREELEEFMYKNPKASVFQVPHMAEVYKREKGCTPLTLVAINEDTGEILASLLAKILEEKRGFLSYFSRHSTIRGGPIFVDNKDGIEAVSVLLENYNKIVAKDTLYSRIYPLNDVPQVIPAFKKNGYKYEYWQNFLIDLTKTKEELWSKLKRDKKRAVTKAKAKGVEIEEITDKSLIPTFYDLVKETYTDRETPLEDISLFNAVFDILVPKNMAKFFMAKHEDMYIAARLALTYRGVIYDWHVGAPKDYLSLYPNDLLVWHRLEWGSENGFHTFDFGGGGELQEAKEGWVDFKRRFGGNSVNYGRYTRIHKPKKLWFAKKAFGLYRKMLKRRLLKGCK